MSNALSPQVRAAIIKFDPAQPHALSVSDFCKSLKISRSAYYKIRTRASRESAGALHPLSRAPRQPARRYGAEVINELVAIRKRLKSDGWDYGPRSIHYEAALAEEFPGARVPSVATIARLLAMVGQVDASPRKRPRSSYVPFVRATCMALWQLDAFEYPLSTGTIITIYQVLDDASRYDVGTWAYERSENSADAQGVLTRAIEQYGAPQELLSDNSSAFNQLRQGSIGTVEVFLASRGTMPISGLPGKPTTQGKTERSHQTLIRFLDAHQPASVKEVRRLITRYREHYNNRRPHQALGQATPKQAWDLLEHTPATEPIPIVVLEAKAAGHRYARNIRTLDKAAITITKTGEVIPNASNEGTRAANQGLVEITRANRQVYYQGYHVSLPSTFADRLFYRTITDDEFLLADPTTGEIVFSFPLPMMALRTSGRYVASYSIRGVHVAYPTKPWQRQHKEFLKEFQQRERGIPELFEE